MKSIIIAGVTVVNLALIFYSIAIITEQRKNIISKRVVFFLTLGVFFDILATSFMIIGSENSAFSPHGILGYSSLTGMLIDAILVWRHKSKYGYDTAPSKGLHLYSRFAYIWWLLAYITGAILVMS
jgi:uncharacterized repeat protein (TIGR03987 family)